MKITFRTTTKRAHSLRLDWFNSETNGGSLWHESPSAEGLNFDKHLPQLKQFEFLKGSIGKKHKK